MSFSQSSSSATSMAHNQGKPLGDGIEGMQRMREAPVFTSFDKFFQASQEQINKIEIRNCAPGMVYNLAGVGIGKSIVNQKAASIFNQKGSAAR